MVTVFLSHAEEDLSVAEEISKHLRKIGVSGYIQSRRAGFGIITLSERIKKAIKDSRFLIPLLSVKGASSAWVNQEIGYAQGVGVPILPLKSKGVKLAGFIEGYKYVQLDLTHLTLVTVTLIRTLKDELEIEVATGECPTCLTPVNFNIRDRLLSELDQRGLVITKKCPVCKTKLKLEPKLLNVSVY